MAETFTTVCVSLEDREDGGLRVTSADMPGLILSGPDKETVTRKIAPAISALFKAAKGLEVTVIPTKSVAEILDGENPQTVDMDVCTTDSNPRVTHNIHKQVFVVELRRAA